MYVGLFSDRRVIYTHPSNNDYRSSPTHSYIHNFARFDIRPNSFVNSAFNFTANSDASSSSISLRWPLPNIVNDLFLNSGVSAGLGMIWKWTCGTTCAAAAPAAQHQHKDFDRESEVYKPLFCTIFQSYTPVTFASTLLSLVNQTPNSLASSSVTSDIFSWCFLVVTSRCPGDNGMMSKNAMHSGVLSTTNAEGETSS